MPLIDTHCHILPGLDDGASQLEEAVQMAFAASRSGIDTIIATPHHANGIYDNEAAEVEAAVHALNAVLLERKIDVTVLPGQEVRVYPGLLDDLAAGMILTLNNTQYVLLELPSYQVPDYLKELVYELQLLGITPVLAHPERNGIFLGRPRLLREYVDSGVICQVTSQSLLGLFGRKIQKRAIKLCEENMAHLIASDAHNMGTRGNSLKEGYRFLRHYVQETQIQTYMDNAVALLHNDPVQRLPNALRRRKWFHFMESPFKHL